MDPRLKHPFTCVVAGPTGCGKTRFVASLVKHVSEMIVPVPQKIIWCYGEYQSFYSSMAHVEFSEGLPDLSRLDSSVKNLLVLDDLMSETDERLSNFFTKISHHREMSIISIIQNVFDKGKHSRTISLNAQYMVLFKNPRDATQVVHLAKQMYPGQLHFVKESFRDATSKPHGYLLVDLKQDTPDHLRLRTNIFPDEIQFVYMRKV